MKRIILASMILCSNICFGQIKFTTKDSSITNKETLKLSRDVSDYYTLNDNTDYSFHWTNKVIVYDSAHNKTAEVDSAGNLRVYGDTINTIKEIMRSYNVKVN